MLEALGGVGHRGEHAVALDHLVGRERERAGHVVLDHRLEPERVLVDLDDRRVLGGAALAALGLVAQERQRALDRVAQHGDA